MYTDSICLFQTPLWLDTVCGDKWDVAIYEVDGKIVAALPYHIKKKYGITAHINPKLTPYQGPWYIIPDKITKVESRQSWIKKVLKDLINQIPKVSYVNLSCTTDIKDIQPFIWAKYRQRTRYTYHVHPTEEAEIKAQLSSKTRSAIKSATQKLSFSTSDDLDTFISLVEASFRTKDMPLLMGEDVYRAIATTLMPLERCEISLAYQDNKAIAGIMTVSDAHKVYYIASGKIKNANSGAVAALLFDAMCKTARQGKIFDFEGSDMSNLESFFRSFGGIITPYHQIYRSRNVVTDSLLMLVGKLE